VVDHQAFAIWKDEAFKAWMETWAVIYKPKEGVEGDEASVSFLQKCQEDLYLVNIVDNDYIEGDLYSNLLKFTELN